MKTVLRSVRFLVGALLIPVALVAAEFEGTLEWSIKAEVTDPAMKAQMEAAQREMADPAKLAEMKAALENPQMRAMMEQNPQMKAMMEAQLKMTEDAVAGKSADILSQMMPKGMTLRARAGRTNMKIEGGPMPMEVIGQNTPPSATLIDRPARTFSRLPIDEKKADAEQTGHIVTKIGETTRVLGYTCEKYLVEATRDGEKMAGVIWATQEIVGLDPSALSRSSVGGEDAYLADIDGVPLRMELSMPQMTVRMEATAVRAESISPALFTIPEGFVETPLELGGRSE